jgi:cell division protein FtsB
VDAVTIPVPAAIAILALLVVLALMLASLLSAGERSQAEIWRQQWAAATDAVRQLTRDATAARDERDRARNLAVDLEQEIADIHRTIDKAHLHEECRNDLQVALEEVGLR